MPVRNLISIEDVSLNWWNELYNTCRDIISKPDDYIDSCRGRVMASLFFEPSTRTQFSFQAAMQRLGGGVFGFSDPRTTSVSKGETLADTIRIAGSYADTIVIRSPLEGAAFAASLYADVPVINAGDGGHFHPTQTLADLTTICQKRGKIANLCVGLCGDLKYGRTVHSLVMALSKFPGIKFYLISPDELKIPEYMLHYMLLHGQSYEEVTNLEDVLPELDILYMTRVQRERFSDPQEYEKLRGCYVFDKKKLAPAKSDMLIMHPLPRVDEIAYEIDYDPRAVYFEQARLGMYIRMALLLQFTRLPRELQPKPEANNESRCESHSCITKVEPSLPSLTVGTKEHFCAYCDKKILTFRAVNDIIF